MTLLEKGNAAASEEESHDTVASKPTTLENTYEARVAATVPLAGSLAIEQLLDDATRRTFVDSHYGQMDHMGG
jgi:hypothetical protein